jgi:hypothetical protein
MRIDFNLARGNKLLARLPSEDLNDVANGLEPVSLWSCPFKTGQDQVSV